MPVAAGVTNELERCLPSNHDTVSGPLESTPSCSMAFNKNYSQTYEQYNQDPSALCYTRHSECVCVLCACYITIADMAS
uniref:Uncharacterized protein n=1 Tax=Ciona savignyi TaxID=51511 RepID=H2Y6P1_CIOSA